ncbi:hypothetical protein ACU6U9_12465 [Pseudomonas sp. HK3]
MATTMQYAVNENVNANNVVTGIQHNRAGRTAGWASATVLNNYSVTAKPAGAHLHHSASYSDITTNATNVLDGLNGGAPALHHIGAKLDTWLTMVSNAPGGYVIGGAYTNVIADMQDTAKLPAVTRTQVLEAVDAAINISGDYIPNLFYWSSEQAVGGNTNEPGPDDRDTCVKAGYTVKGGWQNDLLRNQQRVAAARATLNINGLY